MNTQNNELEKIEIAKKIEIEKRKRNQIYNKLDYILNNSNYFDFFSKDCFAIIKSSQIILSLLSRSKLTSELLLFSFFKTNSKVKNILSEYGITNEIVKELIFKQSEIKLNQNKKDLLSFLKNSKEQNKTKINNTFQVDFSPELNKIFEKAAENAIKRFKTPIISSDILFITLMEDTENKASKLVRKILKSDTEWYVLRYRLLKELHLHESMIRGEVNKNQHYFAYLLKSRLSDNDFDQLIKKDIINSSVLLFRNYLITDLLKINLFPILSSDIMKSNKIANKRTYSS